LKIGLYLAKLEAKI